MPQNTCCLLRAFKAGQGAGGCGSLPGEWWVGGCRGLSMWPCPPRFLCLVIDETPSLARGDWVRLLLSCLTPTVAKVSGLLRGTASRGPRLRLSLLKSVSV